MPFGLELKEKIEKTYPEYLKNFPRYHKALDLMVMLMDEKDRARIMFNSSYDHEIEYVITHEPLPVIELIPKKEPTLLTWNGDYYFDRYYVWKDISDRGVVTALELLGDTSALVKMFLSVRLHNLLYEKVGYQKMSFIESLKVKQTFPVNQLLKRIRNYYQIPTIKFDNDDPMIQEIDDAKEKVLKDPSSDDVKKYSVQISNFESKSGIKLTTDEKIEFIAEKIADQLISDDYDEIES